MKRTLGLLVIPLAVALAVVLVGAGDGNHGSTDQEQAAREDALRRLDAFEPPPRAREIASLPDLDGPPSEPVTPNLLDAGRIWVTPESVAQVRAWVQSHQPDDVEFSGHGTFFDHGIATIWNYMYYLTELRGVARQRSLQLSVTAHGKGAALRADAQAVWIQPRPSSAQIPLSVDFLEVKRTHESGHRHTEEAVVRGARVRQLATLINGFGIIQPGTTSCTQPGPQAELTLTFRRSRNAGAVAVASYEWPKSNCDFLTLRIRGKEQPGLEESWILNRNLRPILARLSP